MEFTTKKISKYGKDTEPAQGVSNAYPTPKDAISQPCLCGIYGLRASGKSHTCSKIVAQAQKDKTFDRIYIITPTFLSNVAYFGKYINEEDVYEPTRDSIDKVIECVEQDCFEYEQFLVMLKDYNDFIKKVKSKKDTFTDDEIFRYMEYGWLNDDYNMERPRWKYAIERVPTSLLILDDVLGSPVIYSKGFTQVGTLNRHIAPLSEPIGDRSAGGLAVIFNSQTYSMAQGISRCLRENMTHMLVFKNRQQKQLDKMIDELAGSVDEEKFRKAYNYAIQDKHDSLLVTFKPKCVTKTFIRNLNEAIVFKDDEKECKCHN